jgi:hypothetical protein
MLQPRLDVSDLDRRGSLGCAIQGVTVTYLIVGVDGRTLVPWHRNVLAPDASTARHIARSRAANEGVVLVVAAVIGAGGEVVPAPPIPACDAERSPRARGTSTGRRPLPTYGDEVGVV